MYVVGRYRLLIIVHGISCLSRVPLPPRFLLKEKAGPFTGFIHTFAVLNPGA
jgi:hypothetical protein